jgi:uroporphyrin-III C-methyltransferase
MSAYLAAGRVADIGPVEPAGGLMVSLQLDGQRAVVIGGGPVAAQRARLLRAAGADVVVVAPKVNAELAARAARGELRWEAREVVEDDITGAIVMAAVDDRAVSAQIAAWARARRVLVNVADEPAWCDLYVPAVHRDGPVQIAVSTGGEGPGMAARARDLLAAALPAGLAEAVRRFGALRRAVRAHDPAPESSARRMDFLRPIGASWPLAALAALDVSAVLARYPEALPAPISLETDGVGGPDAAHREGDASAAAPAGTPDPRADAPTLSLAGARRADTSAPDHARGDAIAAPPPLEVHRSALFTPGVGAPGMQAARGLVQLVGAGPGDVRLLTLGAVEALREADLVLSDRLVPSAVRALAGGEVRVAGKEAGLADTAQAELDRAAIEAARAGRRVVRLKIGDPGLFGRLGEELDAYTQAGVACEIIPGVSSALAAPALAGIPLTLRGVADRVVVGTGHAAGDGRERLPAYEPGVTWVFLMAAARLEALVGGLRAQGFPAELPACTVESASLPGERVTVSTLAGLPTAARGVKAPAVVVVGEVVRAGAPALARSA